MLGTIILSDIGSRPLESLQSPLSLTIGISDSPWPQSQAKAVILPLWDVARVHLSRHPHFPSTQDVVTRYSCPW
jgi:hypothetical protein